MMSEMQVMVGFVDVMECLMKKSLSLMRWVFNWVEKWWSGWEMKSWNKRDVSTWKFLFEKQTYFKIELDPLLLKKTSLCSHTKAPLSLSKGKWRKWVSWGQNMGFIYMNGGEGYAKSHSNID